MRRITRGYVFSFGNGSPYRGFKYFYFCGSSDPWANETEAHIFQVGWVDETSHLQSATR